MKQLYLSLLFCLFAGLMPGAQALPPEWITDEISGDPLIDDRFTVQSFAMGPDNTYHLVLERWDHEEINENGGFILYYMTKPCDGEWSEPELIHTLGESCVSPTIACDPNGRVFVCYQRYMPVDYWSDVIYVAERTEEGWVREEIPTPTPFENWMPQMTMDANGKLHIAYSAMDPEACNDKSRRPKEDRLLYADKNAQSGQGRGSCDDMVIAYSTNLSGEWETQILKAPLGNFGLGAYPRLEVSPEGTAHMVFRGMDVESDPNFPVYRIYYATNLMPNGDFWELEMLQSEMLYDEEAFLVLHEDVVHVALGGSNAWEMPNYTFYLKRAGGDWTTPVQVNEIAFGYPTAIATDADGSVYITYISEAGQSYIGDLFLWKKTGDITQETSLIHEESLCANDFIFDLHGNILVPYLTWTLKTVTNDFFEQTPVYNNPLENNRLPANPAVFDLFGNLHLVTEAFPANKGIEDGSQSLLYLSRDHEEGNWGVPDTIPTPLNRPVHNGSCMATYSQNLEDPYLILGYLSESEEVKNGSRAMIPRFVIGEQKGEGWVFEDTPFELSTAEIKQGFLTTDYENRKHAAVFVLENLPDKGLTPFIHYAVEEDEAWLTQSIELPSTAYNVFLVPENSGAACFVVSSMEGENHQIRFLRNAEAGGTAWNEISFEAGSSFEKISAKHLDPYLFVAAQTRQDEGSSSKVELFVLISGQQMLGPIAVSPEGLPSYELHAMDVTWGTVIVSYAELRNEGSANPLLLATLNEDFQSFNQIGIPAIDVFDSFLLIDPYSYYHILTEQGESGLREISEIFMGTSVNFEISSKFKLLRSGECMDFTDVETPLAGNTLSLFPNPARGQLNLRWDEARGQGFHVAIYDIAGRLRLEKNLDAGQLAGEFIPVDISELEEGLYMIRLISGTHLQTAKFLVR